MGVPALRQGSRYGVPPTTKKLFAIDNPLAKKKRAEWSIAGQERIG